MSNFVLINDYKIEVFDISTLNRESNKTFVFWFVCFFKLESELFAGFEPIVKHLR